MNEVEEHREFLKKITRDTRATVMQHVKPTSLLAIDHELDGLDRAIRSEVEFENQVASASDTFVRLGRDERRLLVLAMGITSLQDIIPQIEDENLVGKMKAQVMASKNEFDKLLEIVDQAALVEKLT